MVLGHGDDATRVGGDAGAARPRGRDHGPPGDLEIDLGLLVQLSLLATSWWLQAAFIRSASATLFTMAGSQCRYVA